MKMGTLDVPIATVVEHSSDPKPWRTGSGMALGRLMHKIK
jgi:hypothetical protein